jgi:hypothetical protein
MCRPLGGARLLYRAVTMTVTSRATVVGVLALISSVVLTLIVVGFTLLSLAIAAQNRDGGYCETIDHPGECESEGLTAVVGFGLTSLGLWGAAAGGGLLLGRRWAPRSAMLVFSAWALLVTAAGVLTTADDEGGPAPGGVLAWLLIVGYFVVIAVLADGVRPARQS